MTVGIVGLGLIGGSLAKSIKLHTDHRVLGMDIKETEMLKAELVEAIDERLSDDNIGECDIVIVALYPGAIVEYITAQKDAFKKDALIVDCGGVKGNLCDTLFALTADCDFTFIGGHPMAGREYSGFQHAKDDLFERAAMILTPRPNECIEQIARAKAFFLEIGFLRVVICTPIEHDEMIAYTSQMAHIISSAYVKSELAQKHKGFSAGSFADMTRVARLNEHMWTELFLENPKPLVRELDEMIMRLMDYRAAIADGDKQSLTDLLREGREIKETLSR